MPLEVDTVHDDDHQSNYVYAAFGGIGIKGMAFNSVGAPGPTRKIRRTSASLTSLNYKYLTLDWLSANKRTHVRWFTRRPRISLGYSPDVYFGGITTIGTPYVLAPGNFFLSGSGLGGLTVARSPEETTPAFGGVYVNNRYYSVPVRVDSACVVLVGGVSYLKIIGIDSLGVVTDVSAIYTTVRYSVYRLSDMTEVFSSFPVVETSHRFTGSLGALFFFSPNGQEAICNTSLPTYERSTTGFTFTEKLQRSVVPHINCPGIHTCVYTERAVSSMSGYTEDSGFTSNYVSTPGTVDSNSSEGRSPPYPDPPQGYPPSTVFTGFSSHSAEEIGSSSVRTERTVENTLIAIDWDQETEQLNCLWQERLKTSVETIYPSTAVFSQSSISVYRGNYVYSYNSQFSSSQSSSSTLVTSHTFVYRINNSVVINGSGRLTSSRNTDFQSQGSSSGSSSFTPWQVIESRTSSQSDVRRLENRATLLPRLIGGDLRAKCAIFCVVKEYTHTSTATFNSEGNETIYGGFGSTGGSSGTVVEVASVSTSSAGYDYSFYASVNGSDAKDLGIISPRSEYTIEYQRPVSENLSDSRTKSFNIGTPPDPYTSPPHYSVDTGIALDFILRFPKISVFNGAVAIDWKRSFAAVTAAPGRESLQVICSGASTYTLRLSDAAVYRILPVQVALSYTM